MKTRAENMNKTLQHQSVRTNGSDNGYRQVGAPPHHLRDTDRTRRRPQTTANTQSRAGRSANGQVWGDSRSTENNPLWVCSLPN